MHRTTLMSCKRSIAAQRALPTILILIPILEALCRLSFAQGTQFVYASDYNANRVLKFDQENGQYLGVLAQGSGLGLPDGMCFSSIGTLYVTSKTNGRVIEFDRLTGTFIRNVCFPPAPEDAQLGPDGMLYTTRFADKNIRRYDPSTGSFMGVFGVVSTLANPVNLQFGRDGDLYVCGFTSGNVGRLDGSSGGLLADFVAGGAGGIQGLEGLAWGPDGYLYLASRMNGQILKFAGDSGAFLGMVAQLPTTGAQGLTFLCNGNLIASTFGSGNIYEIDVASGAIVRIYDNPGGNRSSGLLAWPGQPSVRRSPSDALACPVGGAVFDVAESGSGPLMFLWERETAPGSGVFVALSDGPSAAWDGRPPGVGAIVAGATTPTLSVMADFADGRLLSSIHAIRVRCRVGNECGETLSLPAQLSISECRADLDCSGAVDGGDIGTLLGNWGSSDFSADIDGDGVVDGADLGGLIATWGECSIVP